MNITAASFDFRIRALEPLILPSYKGSTLRGGFGYAFRRVVCAIKDRECHDCLLRGKCVYSYVFETPPPQDTIIMRKYRTAPHPFLIEPPPEKRRGFKTGEELFFRFILIGKAIDYLPYFVYAFDELGRIGIGKGKAKYELLSVSCDETIIYDSESKTLKPFKSSTISLAPSLSLRGNAQTISKNNSETISISFLTPTRIIYNGHLTLDLEFHIFMRNLLRRLALLSYFHCGEDPSAWDFRGLIEQAEKVRVKEHGLMWYDWERYSGRQDTRMKMGGFVGKITFEGNITPFMPFIRAGEVVHVGKGTSFGLGKYAIV
jgi:CRISPR-associated endoribonuclease Cas6